MRTNSASGPEMPCNALAHGNVLGFDDVPVAPAFRGRPFFLIGGDGAMFGIEMVVKLDVRE